MKYSELRDGDLLFVTGSSEVDQAIQTSTGRFSHVGIYMNGKVYHASFPNGVEKLALADFLKSEYRYHVYTPQILDKEDLYRRAEELLGLPYNSSFYPNGEGFYCSQFISAIFPVFEEIPMEFGDGLQEVSDFWKDYYHSLGVEVPLGQLGTNPSQLAESEQLRFRGVLDD